MHAPSARPLDSDVATGETPPEPAPSPSNHRFWIVAAVVVAIVAIVGVVIGLSLGTRQGGPLASQGGGNGRPNIVVPAPSTEPSASVSPSPATVASTVVAGATPPPQAGATQYVVQPGDTLRSIALDQYGDAELWQTIYQANRSTIGANRDALVAGKTLQIPTRQ